MNIRLYNSLTSRTEDFTPLKDNHVRLYSCGPTVYNYAHIGNMRAFLFADLLQRTLRTVGGYTLDWVMNITNIDDKTIRDSAPGSQEWKEEMGEQTNDPMKNILAFTQFYETCFLDDITKLGIKTSDFYSMPRATDYIKSMQQLVLKIVNNGYGYVAGGSVYFNVSEYRKKENYGKLKKIDFDNFRSGVRMDADLYERDQVSDFVLWKARKEGEPFWEFDVNGENCPGRPGWHLECSAMERELLGLPFDIHTGGVDLKFPHHEDEIAQSKAGYGKEPTAFWCHNEFLEVESEKMSKSKGNFYTLRDLIDKGIDPLDIRFSMMSSHYGSTYNFTFDGISASHKGRMRVQEFIYKLFSDEPGDEAIDVELLRRSVFRELGNDLHTPKALANLFDFINNNKNVSPDLGSKEKLIEFFTDFNNIFEVWKIGPDDKAETEIPEEIILMAEKRIQARKEKNWTEADRLRDEINKAGYAVKDTKDSFEITRINE